MAKTIGYAFCDLVTSILLADSFSLVFDKASCYVGENDMARIWEQPLAFNPQGTWTLSLTAGENWKLAHFWVSWGAYLWWALRNPRNCVRVHFMGQHNWATSFQVFLWACFGKRLTLKLVDRVKQIALPSKCEPWIIRWRHQYNKKAHLPLS